MQVCKYVSKEVCKYRSMHVQMYRSMQVYKYACMQVCRYASMQESEMHISSINLPMFVMSWSKLILPGGAAKLIWWSSRAYMVVYTNFHVKPNFSLVKLGCSDVKDVLEYTTHQNQTKQNKSKLNKIKLTCTNHFLEMYISSRDLC